MDKLISIIEENIQTTVRDYMLLISSKYNIDINELEKLWKSPSSTSSSTPSSKPSSPKPKESKTTTPKTSKPSSPKETPKNKCTYKFTKGKQQGETCNGGVKGDSLYCSKHIKFEETGQKDKKPSLPVSTTTEKKSVDRLVRLNKEINKWWHVESKLVFKSDKEKIVVGVYKDDIYRDLCDADIEDCNKYGFRYELPAKKIEKTKPAPIKTEKKTIAKEINMHAKNIEDVISDMLDDTHLDSDNEEPDDLDEELAEELEELEEEV
jgi:hypothetical protein